MFKELDDFSNLDGFLYSCMVDSETGAVLDSVTCEDSDTDLEAISAATTLVFKAKLSALASLSVVSKIDDISLTIGAQYQIVRPLENNADVFLVLGLDADGSNISLARLKLKSVAENLVV